MTTRPPMVDDLDWSPESARELGEAALDMWVEFLEQLPSLPVNRPFKTEQVRDAVTFPVPEEPMSHDHLAQYMRKVMFDYSAYPGHPGFLAWICSAGTVPGAVAELLVAALNQNLAGWSCGPAATEIELHLIRWMAEQFGLPGGSGGFFVSGGATANWTCMKLARDVVGGETVAATGLAGGPPLAFYASSEVHGVLVRAADLLGIGRRGLRHIPVDDHQRIRVDELEAAIERDLAQGVKPIAVVATAGTTGTGAVDPIDDLADVAGRRGLWLHVDACYGGGAILSEELKPLLRGIERADSIAFDPHKWMYTPLSSSCVLVKDFDHLPESFSFDASYIYRDKKRTGTGNGFAFMSPMLSRPFMGFKLWLSLLAHGRKAFERRIEHDVELARYLAELVAGQLELESGPPVTLSICCFRYAPPDLPEGEARDEYLEQLNRRLAIEIQLDGRVWCSNAMIDGRFFLRMCSVNFRAEAEQMDLLVEAALEHGRRLDDELRPDALRAPA